MGSQSSKKSSTEVTWSIEIKVSPTIKYVLTTGQSTISKITGVEGSLVEYEVNPVDGAMSLVRSNGTKIASGTDGNLNQLLDTLSSMESEIKSYFPGEDESD